jgi:hypothetical protein
MDTTEDFSVQLGQIYWAVWPESHHPTQNFPTKIAARRYVDRHGGGAIRGHRRRRGLNTGGVCRGHRRRVGAGSSKPTIQKGPTDG